MIMAPVNADIEKGLVSSQSANTLHFILLIFQFTPIFMLLFAFLFAMREGVAGRDGTP
jgi:hypothetical protein